MFPIWRIGDSKPNYVVIGTNGKEYIHNIDIYNPIEITPGLNELSFNDAKDKSIITKDDIDTWERLLLESGIPKQYKS